MGDDYWAPRDVAARAICLQRKYRRPHTNAFDILTVAADLLAERAADYLALEIDSDDEDYKATALNTARAHTAARELVLASRRRLIARQRRTKVVAE
ncbi:hypothetical protein [Xylanimonas protaetiae]|uniref:Uncharacterized protein n=1 Tax=Xylanimonas protaetiae TaxID=2509457 RepID=A0A4P6F433_9MICO|nr:hypothetical protein [Xylanimonas protaetiae]QAY70035.1 hypothetical protein ET471_08295 [Xylanimonas protaetiae]